MSAKPDIETVVTPTEIADERSDLDARIVEYVAGHAGARTIEIVTEVRARRDDVLTALRRLSGTSLTGTRGSRRSLTWTIALTGSDGRNQSRPREGTS